MNSPAVDEMTTISELLHERETAVRRQSSLSQTELVLRAQNEELILRLQAKDAQCERRGALLARARAMLVLHTINLDGLLAEIDAELKTAIQPATATDQNQATVASSTALPSQDAT